MNQDLQVKVLKIAAEICWRHSSAMGNRICQDWGGDTALLDALTEQERDVLQYQFEQYNSKGEDYEPGFFPYDEMVISSIVAYAIERLVDRGNANEWYSARICATCGALFKLYKGEWLGNHTTRCKR